MLESYLVVGILIRLTVFVLVLLLLPLRFTPWSLKLSLVLSFACFSASSVGGLSTGLGLSVLNGQINVANFFSEQGMALLLRETLIGLVLGFGLSGGAYGAYLASIWCGRVLWGSRRDGGADETQRQQYFMLTFAFVLWFWVTVGDGSWFSAIFVTLAESFIVFPEQLTSGAVQISTYSSLKGLVLNTAQLSFNTSLKIVLPVFAAAFSVDLLLYVFHRFSRIVDRQSWQLAKIPALIMLLVLSVYPLMQEFDLAADRAVKAAQTSLSKTANNVVVSGNSKAGEP